MTKIPLSLSNRSRALAGQPLVAMRNRFVEKNPVLSDDGPSFIARPGLAYWTTVGDGPIRAMYQQPGAFDDSAFVASGDELWKLSRTGDAGNTMIFNGLVGASSNATVNMAVTGDIGEIGPRLFFADGAGLYVYASDGFGVNTLTASAIVDGDTVSIANIYYRFSSGTLDAGAPDGTSGAPWRVLIGGTIIQSLTNLFNAINATSAAGTDYSTALTAPHASVRATAATVNALYVRASSGGAGGNGIACAETGAGLSWATATTSGGGSANVVQVPTPDGVGVIDVVNINNFVVVIPAQGAGINGRFYWIEPGEVEIDPLNYATAERSADPVNAVRVFNDQFWLLGQNTTEVWYPTGDADVPMLRLQNSTFDRGVQQGTAVQVKDSVILVDSFGAVIQISGGEKRLSTPDIEEVVRKAISYQNLRLL